MSLPPSAPGPRVVCSTAGEPLGPQHLDSIAALLQAAMAADNSTREHATAQMAALANRPAWRCCLLRIGLSGRHTDTLRVMALTQVKNSLGTMFARRLGPMVVSADQGEKDVIKQMLLAFHAPVPAAGSAEASNPEAMDAAAGSAESPHTSDRVADFISTCISIVARWEWPAHWNSGNDSLFPRLLAALQNSPSYLGRRRASYTLHLVLKQLQPSQLQVAVAKFQAASEGIVPCVRAKWMELQNQIAATLQAVIASNTAASFTPEVLATLLESSKLSLLYLKCLKRMVMYGIKDVARSADTQTLYPEFLKHLRFLVDVLPRFAPPAGSDPSSASAAAAAASQMPFLAPLHAVLQMMMHIVNETVDKRALQFVGWFVPFAEFAAFVLQHNAAALSHSGQPIKAESGVDPAWSVYPTSTVLEPLCIECTLYLQQVLREYTKSPMVALAIQGHAMHAGAQAGGAGGAADAIWSQIQELRNNLFTSDFVRRLLWILLSHYVVLTRSDMESWEEAPELFYNQERSGLNMGDDDDDNDESTLVVMSSRHAEGGGGGAGGGHVGSSAHHEYTLRGIASTLVMQMIEKMPEVSASLLVEMLMAIVKLCPAGALTAAVPAGPQAAEITAHLGGEVAQRNLLLLKESIYAALGFAYLVAPLALQQLTGLSFAAFFEQILVAELSTQSPAHRLIRRRVVWLLGEWVEHVSDALRAQIFNACLALLQENDLLVRMAAIDTVFKLIDNVPYSAELGLGASDDQQGDSEENALDLTVAGSGGGLPLSPAFEAFLAHFSQHLRLVLMVLFTVLQSLEELGTQRHILMALKKILGVMGQRIIAAEGCLPLLLERLPAIWVESFTPASSLLRTTILDVVSSLVEALGWQSQHIHASIVLPMLTRVFDPASLASASTNFVVSEALSLWKQCLHNAVSFTPDLSALFAALIAHIKCSTSNLQKSLDIIESYVHLGGLPFMQRWGAEIGAVFAGLLTKENESQQQQPSAAGRSVGGMAQYKSGALSLSPATDGEGLINDDAIAALMAVLESIVQLHPLESPQCFVHTFAFMLRGIVDESRNFALSVATSRDGEGGQRHVVCDPVLAKYNEVLGRLLFQNAAGGLALIGHLAATVASPSGQLHAPGELLSTLLDSMSRKLDAIPDTHKKKVVVLAMVGLMTSGNEAVLTKIKSIAACVRRIEKEINQWGGPSEQPEWRDALQTPPEQRIETHRIKLMVGADPSNNVGARDFFLSQLQSMLSQYGAERMQMIAQSCDPQVMHEIQQGFQKK